MSFTVSSLRDALGVPSTKLPINGPIFVSYVIPLVVCYFIVAVLAVTPRTRAIRVALCPVVALLAFRAAVSVDMSQGNPERKFFNIEYVVRIFQHELLQKKSLRLGSLRSFLLQRTLICIAVYTLSWTLAKKPLVRYLRPANSSPSAIMDALDLITNLRGHGWDWSRGLYVPRETRPTNRVAFAFYALLSGIAHGWMCGVIHLAIQTFTAGVGSSTQGPTIFDETLPFFVRYFRASIISTLGAFSAYGGLQLGYDLTTVPGVLLFGQDPAQWPPGFDNPWYATSLNEFWGRRWHQWFRHMFVLCSYPLSVVLGRAGTVIGAFLSSGLFHHIMMTTLDSQSEMWRMLVPFGMMAPGIFAERAFYRLTGRKVGGVVGWVWTLAWLLLWGNVMVDGFARAGMFASSSAVDSQLPLHALVEKLVINFDTWLHAI